MAMLPARCGWVARTWSLVQDFNLYGPLFPIYTAEGKRSLPRWASS